jgi:hypothetical protein
MGPQHTPTDKKILALRKDLDFQRLMDCPPLEERSKSPESDAASVETSEYKVEAPHIRPNIRSHQPNTATNLEASLYLMGLSSPGLETPPQSPRMSMVPRDSLADIPYGGHSNSSTQTLLSAESMRTLNDDEVVPGYIESLLDKPLPELPRQERDDEIPRYWRSELEKPLPKLPYEIAPGILAM